jgi:hypothetical protein
MGGPHSLVRERDEDGQLARKKILVVGYYGKGNVGDESFRPAFQAVWPQWDFEFADKIPEAYEHFDAIIIGGGSLLSAPLQTPFPQTLNRPVAFVSVDDHAPHAAYKGLLKEAKVVLSRSPGTKHRFAPDIVFALTPDKAEVEVKAKVASVFMNDFFPAKADHPKYKHVAWDWFAHEFAGAMDAMIEGGWALDFIPMCSGAVDDRRTAGSVISLMKHSARAGWWVMQPEERSIKVAIASSKLVISARYHGCIFAAMQGVPFIAISSHDKFNDLAKYMTMDWAATPYYGFQKAHLLQRLASADGNGRWAWLKALDAKRTWKDISASVEQKLFG